MPSLPLHRRVVAVLMIRTCCGAQPATLHTFCTQRRHPRADATLAIHAWFCTRSFRRSSPSPIDFVATPNDRGVFAMMNLTGTVVRVQTKERQVWEGVLKVADFEESGHLELAMAKKVVGPEELAQKPEEKKVFKQAEVVRFTARDIDLYNDEGGEARRNRGAPPPPHPHAAPHAAPHVSRSVRPRPHPRRGRRRHRD